MTNLNLFKDKEEVSKEDLINLNVLLSNREILQNLYKRINIKKPKQPKSDAPLEDLEKYQKEIDEFPAKEGRTY